MKSKILCVILQWPDRGLPWGYTQVFFFTLWEKGETPHIFRSLVVTADPASRPGIYRGSSARCVDDLVTQPPLRESDWCRQVFAGPWRTRSEVDQDYGSTNWIPILCSIFTQRGGLHR